MQIIWYGHSCFLIKTSIGKRILINPFKNNFGYKNDFPKCDLITYSNNQLDSSYLNETNLPTKIINTSGNFEFEFINILGFNSFHDGFNGLKRGSNIIYLYKLGDFSICHLGNLGHIPSSLVLEKLKNIDILLVPIGGHFTINGLEASKLCNLISPEYIIPMNYKTNNTSIFLDDPKDFILSMKNIKKINSNLLDISKLHFNNTLKCNCILLTPPYK